MPGWSVQCVSTDAGKLLAVELVHHARADDVGFHRDHAGVFGDDFSYDC